MLKCRVPPPSCRRLGAAPWCRPLVVSQCATPAARGVGRGARLPCSLGRPARCMHAPSVRLQWQVAAHVARLQCKIGPTLATLAIMQAGRMDLIPGVLGRAERGFRQVIPSPDGKHLVLLGASGSLLLL
jgi:hypothetical protein